MNFAKGISLHVVVVCLLTRQAYYRLSLANVDTNLKWVNRFIFLPLWRPFFPMYWSGLQPRVKTWVEPMWWCLVPYTQQLWPVRVQCKSPCCRRLSGCCFHRIQNLTAGSQPRCPKDIETSEGCRKKEVKEIQICYRTFPEHFVVTAL